MQDERDGGSVIRGECHVEAEAVAPSPNSILVEGLRLRLDLRILPRSTSAESESPGGLRVATVKLTTYPLGMPVYQRRAIWAGLGVVALAIGVWLARPASEAPRPSAPEPRSAPGETASEPVARRALPEPKDTTPHSEPPSSSLDAVPTTPMLRPAPAARGLRAVVSRDSEFRAPVSPRAPSRRAPDPLAPKAAESAGPLAARAPPGDMLELFDDTK